MNNQKISEGSSGEVRLGHAGSDERDMRFQKDAARVSLIGIVGNVILSLMKLAAGLIAHSSAMVSDAIHSASDSVSSVIVIIGVRLSGKAADESHPYGHERFECVAAIVLAVILFITGLFIGLNAVETILGLNGEAEVPGVLAAAAAVISIVSKEIMYHYTMHYAIEYDSSALRASAWDHRSDAFSSIGSLAGVVGARMGYPVLDSVASLVICVFIVKAAYSIFRDAIDKMVDHSCDEETEKAIRAVALSEKGVLGVDLLHTRVFGSKIYVDMEIAADGNESLKNAHATAETVHDAIEKQFPQVKHIMIHVNPR
jgi:cation diffusion facilitator family transporter